MLVGRANQHPPTVHVVSREKLLVQAEIQILSSQPTSNSSGEQINIVKLLETGVVCLGPRGCLGSILLGSIMTTSTCALPLYVLSKIHDATQFVHQR